MPESKCCAKYCICCCCYHTYVLQHVHYLYFARQAAAVPTARHGNPMPALCHGIPRATTAMPRTAVCRGDPWHLPRVTHGACRGKPRHDHHGKVHGITRQSPKQSSLQSPPQSTASRKAYLGKTRHHGKPLDNPHGKAHRTAHDKFHDNSQGTHSNIFGNLHGNPRTWCTSLCYGRPS